MIESMSGRCFRALAAFTVAVAVAGCAVSVKRVTISEDAHALGAYSESREPKRVFSRTDKKVTLHVEFDYNVVASTQRFRVVWTEPSGQAYVGGPVTTVFGSNTSLIVSLKLADTSAAERPGHWSVSVFLEDELIVRQRFEIR